MFLKLLKHEWRATRGTLGILTLAALGMGIFATVDMRLLLSKLIEQTENDFTSNLTKVVMVTMLIVCFVGMIAYVFAVGIYLLIRFYKNKFTDEGYLTFTLPVRVQDIYLSSFVNILIWTTIASVTMIGMMFMFLLFGTATDGLVQTEVLEIFRDLFDIPWEQLLANGDMANLLVLYGIYILVSPLYSLTMILTSITIGAVVAKKHKILMAFGVYYIISAVVSTINSVVSIVPMTTVGLLSQDLIKTYYSSLMGQLLTIFILTSVGYFVSTYLMKNKLNLP